MREVNRMFCRKWLGTAQGIEKPLGTDDTCLQYLKSFCERDALEPTASCYWEVNISGTRWVVQPNKELSNSEIQPQMKWAASLAAFSEVSQWY